MAAVCTPTAASASVSDPDAVISPAGVSAMHSGTSAGTSIKPAPCAVDIMNDHSAIAACPAGLRPDR